MKRCVHPEILDTLPSSDPEALRSRRDLRLINALMRNERWILKKLLKHRLPDETVLELGSGDGSLLKKISVPRHGLDLQPPPVGIETDWTSGDLFQTLPATEAPVIVANLILHHFENGDLQKLGPLLKTRRVLLFCEPWRHPLSLAAGWPLWPFINRVTRHDMPVSIRAGFQKGELPALLDLPAPWQIRENLSLPGGYRMLAWRA